MSEVEDGERPGSKSAAAYRTISEVSDELDVPQHVLRFWETKFTQVRPLKRAGGRRYYRPDDVRLLTRIRDLLYTEGYTIRGVQRVLKERGVKAVIEGQFDPPDAAADGPEEAAAPDRAADPAAAPAPAQGGEPQAVAPDPIAEPAARFRDKDVEALRLAVHDLRAMADLLRQSAGLSAKSE